KALLKSNLALAAAVAAGGRLGAALGARAVAGLAFGGLHEPDHGLGAKRGLGKGELERGSKVASQALFLLTTGPAEELAENAVEEVVDAGKTEPKAGPTVDPGPAQAGVSEAIVTRPLFRIGKHRVGLGDLLETLLGFLVARVFIRVEPDRQRPVRAL